MNLMVDFGQKCKAFMDTQFRGLTLEHVEVDEIWTFVQKKQGRYNFVWRTYDVNVGRTRLPAAMAAGVTDGLMNFGQLFDAAMAA